MDLNSLYKNFLNPGSFSGVSKFYNFVKTKYPNVSRKEVQKFLETSDPYTLHKQKKRVKKFRRIYIKSWMYQFSGDLVEMRNYSQYNHGYNYILNVINCFSKKVYSFPLKRKTGAEVAPILDKLFAKHRPLKFELDKGKTQALIALITASNDWYNI